MRKKEKVLVLKKKGSRQGGFRNGQDKIKNKKGGKNPLTQVRLSVLVLGGNRETKLQAKKKL